MKLDVCGDETTVMPEGWSARCQRPPGHRHQHGSIVEAPGYYPFTAHQWFDSDPNRAVNQLQAVADRETKPARAEVTK